MCNNRGNCTHHLGHLLHSGGTFKILFCNCFEIDNTLLLAIVALLCNRIRCEGDFQPVCANKKMMKESGSLVTKENLHSTYSVAASAGIYQKQMTHALL